MSLFTSTSGERRLALRAGLFVAIGLALAGVVVFFIGQETRLFERQVTYRAYFANVQGLSDQSPVWIGGLKVGKVTGIFFSSDAKDPRLEVRFQVASRYADRVRQDSVAQLSSLGVLGDKAVDISLGSPTAPPVEPGGVLQSSTGGDLAGLLNSAGQVMENTVALSKSLRVAAEAYGDPELAADLKRGIKSLSALLVEVEKGDGVLHALIYDKKAGREVSTLLAHASQAARRVDGAVGHLEALLREVLGNVKRNRILRALVRFSLNNRAELDQLGKVEEAPAVGGAGTAPEPPKP